jgi:NADH-quinone oxidoreductase subunit J
MASIKVGLRPATSMPILTASRIVSDGRPLVDLTALVDRSCGGRRCDEDWMEASTAFYSACVLGAIGVWLLLRRGSRPLLVAGTLLALGVFGWLIAEVGELYAGSAGRPEKPGFFFLFFGAIALAGAVRMITNARPVYSALYFVLVVLSSAALFLLMEAEFMAFALVIVYAGAILITYLFVLMLAQQAPTPGEEDKEAEYDVNPREPLAAVVVGFIMMAVLGSMVWDGPEALPRHQSVEQATAEAWRDLAVMPRRLKQVVEARYPEFDWPPRERAPGGGYLNIRGTMAYVIGAEKGKTELNEFVLRPEDVPNNSQRLGIALVRKFPVSLELAGVILLMAMFGAVVLARRQIEIGEDEKRVAAGLRRLLIDPDDEPRIGAAGGGPRS